MAEESRLVIAIDSQRAEHNLRSVRHELQGVEGAGVSSLNNLRTAAVALTGALAAIGVNGLARATYDAVASSQTLMASLETVTGSAEDAQTAWQDLVDFASNTPFNLDQSVQAFIRMKSLGLDPTESALQSFGNTASAMGKDMMQMVEAVADATTGEFERLKAFGITASKDGETVALTFQGTTTTIANNADAITQYLERIGNTEFAGAMTDQMATLRGQASNLEDRIAALYRAIGDAGATDAFASGLSAASTAVQATTKALKSGDLDGYLSTAATTAQALSVVIGSRLVTALGAATAAKGRDALASVANARAEATAAQQVTRRTGAELAAARAILSTAQLEVAATRNTNAHAFALQSLSAARVRATTAAGAHAAATTTAATAMTRASVAARALSGAMALVGGPIGAAVVAAGALYIYREELGLVAPEIAAVTSEVDNLTNAINMNSEAAIKNGITSLTADLVELERQAKSARAEANAIQMQGPGPGQRGIGAGQGPGRNAAVAAAREAEQQVANHTAAVGRLEEQLASLGQSAIDPVSNSLGKLGETADDVVAKFRPMLDQDIESILDRAGPGAAIDTTGTLRDAWGNALPSLQRELDAQLQGQLRAFESEKNLQKGLEAAAQAFVNGASEAAGQAWSAIAPMSLSEVARKQSAEDGSTSPTVMATTSQSSVPPRAGRSMGTFTIRVAKDGERDTEGTVQGDEDFIRKMASALGSAATAI